MLLIMLNVEGVKLAESAVIPRALITLVIMPKYGKKCAQDLCL